MKRKKRAELAAMETDALTLLLRSEMDKRPLNDALLREILAILRQRESEMPPVELTEEDLAVWGEIETQCAAEKARAKQERSVARRKQIINLGAVAACLSVVLVLLPPAFGANSIADLAKRIANGILTIFSPEDIGKDYVFRTDHPGLQELYNTVMEYGATVPVVPMWLPEGVALDEIKVVHTPSQIKISATFLQGDYFVTMEIYIGGNSFSPEIESDHPELVQITLEGTNYYVASNVTSTTVLWEIENVSCALLTNVDTECCHNILRSIRGKVIL